MSERSANIAGWKTGDRGQPEGSGRNLGNSLSACHGSRRHSKALTISPIRLFMRKLKAKKVEGGRFKAQVRRARTNSICCGGARNSASTGQLFRGFAPRKSKIYMALGPISGPRIFPARLDSGESWSMMSAALSAVFPALRDISVSAHENAPSHSCRGSRMWTPEFLRDSISSKPLPTCAWKLSLSRRRQQYH